MREIWCSWWILWEPYKSNARHKFSHQMLSQFRVYGLETAVFLEQILLEKTCISGKKNHFKWTSRCATKLFHRNLAHWAPLESILSSSWETRQHGFACHQHCKCFMGFETCWNFLSYSLLLHIVLATHCIDACLYIGKLTYMSKIRLNAYTHKLCC